MKDEVDKLLKRDQNEINNMIAQNEDLKKINAEQQKRIAELEQMIANAKTAEDKAQVNLKVAEINNDIAVQRAKERVKRNAFEQISLETQDFFKNYSNTIKLTDDVISAITTFTIKIIDEKTEKTIVQMGNTPYIKYIVTITAKIDTDLLNKSIKKFNNN